MTGTEIFKHTATYEREVQTIRLHAPQWKLLLAFDGQRSLAEVALSAEMAFAEALPLTERFLSSDWITEQPITLDQYLKRTGASSISTISSAVPPAVVLHEPKAAASAAAAATATPVTAATQASARAAAAMTSTPAVATIVTPVPAPLPVSRKMKLESVVDFIMGLGGRGSIGQLLVYRVFLRVPPELLQREEISTIQLTNDNSIISDVSLQEAIANAVNAILNKALPDDVFVPA